MKRVKHLLITMLLLSTAVMSAQEKRNFTLEDIYVNGTFSQRRVSGMRPLKDGKTYSSIDKKRNLNAYSYLKGDSTATFFNMSKLIPEGENKPINISDFTFSENEDKVLFVTNVKSIYRHSYTADYYVYDIQKKSLVPLSQNGSQRLATFSPDASKVAFMRDNNLFIKDLATNSETQFTFDGKYNNIINGAPDWVYEEEFSFSQGFFWSKDSKKIAFYRFNESDVKEFQMEEFEGLYPEWYSFKYPKAGEANSVVEVHVYDLASGKTVKINTGEETDIYIPRIKWTENANELAIQRLNRHQNHLEILAADANTGETKVIYDETNKYYIDITDDWTFLAGGTSFIMTSERDGYNHIYLANYDGSLKQLTSGKWDVTKVYGYDVKGKEVYFQAAKNAPTERQIYAVNLKGKMRDVIDKVGCNDAVFSNNYSYVLNVNSTISTPREYALYTGKGKLVRVLEDNHAFSGRMENFNLGKKELFKISDPAFVMPDGSTVDIDAWMITPPDFTPEKKYPVLIYVYGGPGHQTVLNQWGHSDWEWMQILAQHGIISVSINNRGSGAQGEMFKKMTYLQLGKYETEDMITLAKYMASQPYVDSKRIAIYGWSYGGFMAANGITKGADVISTAVSVAPVTNWRYYDNIYTERFMRTPQENPEGYDANSPVSNTALIKGNYLLCHGSGDDNVHYQNAMELIKSMISNNVQFDLMIYPNKNHGIYGGYEYGDGECRMHLFTKIDKFLYKNLGVRENPVVGKDKPAKINDTNKKAEKKTDKKTDKKPDRRTMKKERPTKKQ
ncbi:MAG: S9 family peptidase [Bacteroidales bacterium]|nr:S9 family peptidase [Bacteroidales bacterium]